jgi:hypothetical protein
MASVKFYNKYNELLLESDNNEGRCEENTLSNDVTLYAEIICGEVDVSFEVQDKNIKNWFPYQFDTGKEVIDYIRHLKPGKYRILLPTTKNEDKIAVKYNGSDNLNAVFYIVPNFTQF